MMKKAFALTAAMILATGVFACSSSSDAASKAAGGECPAVGDKTSCANDAAATQDDVDTCNQAKSDAACGSKFTDYYKCAGANQKCGSDGKTDTSAITQACGSQLSAYISCKTSTPADGGS